MFSISLHVHSHVGICFGLVSLTLIKKSYLIHEIILILVMIFWRRKCNRQELAPPHIVCWFIIFCTHVLWSNCSWYFYFLLFYCQSLEAECILSCLKCTFCFLVLEIILFNSSSCIHIIFLFVFNYILIEDQCICL